MKSVGRKIDPVCAILLAALTFIGCVSYTGTAAASDSWVFRQGYFSHQADGSRATQYTPLPNPEVPYAPNYMVSGYRHTRSTIRGNESYDHLHVVKTWGRGEFIRPYEEWEFPFRPGATPYGPWGNPGGPWTLPFQSWVNPFALGQLPNPPWGYYPPYPYLFGPLQPPLGEVPAPSP